MLYWIQFPGPGRLAIAPRPRGDDWLESELTSLRREGVDVLASLLTDEEEEQQGLTDEAALCRRIGIEFRSFAIPDGDTPASMHQFGDFIGFLDKELMQERSILVHCLAGIGRSSVTAAALLCRHGYQPDDAFDLISRARGLQVPETDEQADWLRQFAQRTDDHNHASKPPSA